MAPSRGPFKPPKVTSSIEFEAMLENMTESSSDDDEDISLHSTPKPGDSLSPGRRRPCSSHLLQEQDDEASSSAAFSPPDHGSIPLESSLESPRELALRDGPAAPAAARARASVASSGRPGGSLLEAAAAASPRPSSASPGARRATR
ncbi:hypothetical protein SO694_0020706 [Aureococcus anophagefferens]|uniref:Uncharacterized protein n=1 Tax=Aureococcus anophagefferens TaxID=44056 RepID=A0ABR1FNK1_AURAN